MLEVVHVVRSLEGMLGLKRGQSKGKKKINDLSEGHNLGSVSGLHP